MSYSACHTKASLTGAKATVIQMLNTAIKNVGNGDAITPEDSLEAIKAEFILTDEEGRESSLRMLFHDFLDMESINDPVMKQRMDAFQEEFGKDNSYEYAVVVNNIIDKGDDCEVERIGDCAFKDCPCAEGMDERYWKEMPVTEVDDAWINEILG